MSKVCRSSAEHYVWGTGCDGWHLLRSGALSVIEERMPPDTKEERHSHKQARQLFYTLEGELEMEVEGSSQTLRTGEALDIAPGQRHQARNRSSADVRFLVISAPPSHGDRDPA